MQGINSLPTNRYVPSQFVPPITNPIGSTPNLNAPPSLENPDQPMTDTQNKYYTPPPQGKYSFLGGIAANTPYNAPIKPVSTNSKYGIGDYMQWGAAAGSVALAALDTPETQNLYQNTAPITQQQFSPSRALLQNQFSTNAARAALTNTYSSSGANANLQNLHANKFRADSGVVTQYDQMNKQATTDYEARLGQRQAENNQNKYQTDNMNSANKAAYTNNIYGALSTISNVGAGLNKGESYNQALKYLMMIDPQAAEWVRAGNDPNEYYKKKMGLTIPTKNG